MATPFAVISVEIGNNWIIFEKRSTMVRIALFPCDSGKGLIMSTDMIFQGHCGTMFDCSGVLAALVTDLVFWHLSHSSTYFSMFFRMVGSRSFFGMYKRFL